MSWKMWRMTSKSPSRSSTPMVGMVYRGRYLCQILIGYFVQCSRHWGPEHRSRPLGVWCHHRISDWTLWHLCEAYVYILAWDIPRQAMAPLPNFRPRTLLWPSRMVYALPQGKNSLGHRTIQKWGQTSYNGVKQCFGRQRVFGRQQVLIRGSESRRVEQLYTFSLWRREAAWLCGRVSQLPCLVRKAFSTAGGEQGASGRK